MCAISAVVGAAARVFDQVALQHQMPGILLGIDGAVQVARDAPNLSAAHSAPAGDVAVLHHDVLDTRADEHAVEACVSEFEAPQDDVAGFHDDVEVRQVEDVVHVPGSGRRRHEQPLVRRPALTDIQRLIGGAAVKIHRLPDGDLFAARAGLKLHGRPAGFESYVVRRARSEVHVATRGTVSRAGRRLTGSPRASPSSPRRGTAGRTPWARRGDCSTTRETRMWARPRPAHPRPAIRWCTAPRGR